MCDVSHAVWAVERLLESLARLNEIGHFPVLDISVWYCSTSHQLPHQYPERPLNNCTHTNISTDGQWVKPEFCLRYKNLINIEIKLLQVNIQSKVSHCRIAVKSYVTPVWWFKSLYT